MKCSAVKCSEGLSTRCLTLLEDIQIIRLQGFFVYHILSCSFGSILNSTSIYGRMFCILLFNFVSYAFSLLRLLILIVRNILFCIFRFHRAIWHPSATLTEGFPCFLPQLQGKCQGITRTDGARPALFPN